MKRDGVYLYHWAKTFHGLRHGMLNDLDGRGD